jgi:hypothetical protein
MDVGGLMEPLKDWRGVPMNVGDTVVYPVRQSSSMWMEEGEIIEISSVDKYYGPQPQVKVRKKDGRISTLTSLGRLTVV